MDLLAVISDPTLMTAAAGGGLVGGGMSLFALKQLLSIKKDITAIKTILINCKGCKAAFPVEHEP